MTTSTLVKKLSIAAVGAACVTVGAASFAAKPAQAAVFTAPFTVNVGIAGTPQTGNGNVLFESSFLSGVGNETLTPSNGLEGLNLSLLSNSYTETDALFFPAFPQIFFNNGVFTGLLFAFNEVTSGETVVVTPFGNQVFASGGGTGAVSVGDATEIPTPALLPGLIGLGMSISTLRKRQAAKAEQA